MSVMIPTWVDGTLTPVEKLEAHLRGLRHKAVSVFVTKGDKILLQQRAMGKYHTPGLWANTCCTHPDWSENGYECAVRRLDEELGITGLEPDYRQTVEYRADVGGGLIEHEVVEIFVSDITGGLDIAPNPEEVMAVRWISRSTLIEEMDISPELFTPWLRIYMREHAPAIFGASEIAVS